MKYVFYMNMKSKCFWFMKHKCFCSIPCTPSLMLKTKHHIDKLHIKFVWRQFVFRLPFKWLRMHVLSLYKLDVNPYNLFLFYVGGIFWNIHFISTNILCTVSANHLYLCQSLKYIFNINVIKYWYSTVLKEQAYLCMSFY